MDLTRKYSIEGIKQVNSIETAIISHGNLVIAGRIADRKN